METRKKHSFKGKESFWQRSYAEEVQREEKSFREGRSAERRDGRSAERRGDGGRSIDRRHARSMDRRDGRSVDRRDGRSTERSDRGSLDQKSDRKQQLDYNRNHQQISDIRTRSRPDKSLGYERGNDNDRYKMESWTSSERNEDLNSRGEERRNRNNSRKQGYQVDKRRWGWAAGGGKEPMQRRPAASWQGRIQQDTDYMEMSSLETLGTSNSSSGDSQHYQPSPHSSASYSSRQYIRKLQNTPASSYQRVSRSRSISRSRSMGPAVYPVRTQSFSSLADSSYHGGTSLNLKPLRHSLSSQALFYEKPSESLSMLELSRSSGGGRIHPPSGSAGRGFRSSPSSNTTLLDLKNITVNDSEIQQDDALAIVEISRRAIVRGGVDGLKGTALYGRVAGWIKDSVEEDLSHGNWQCVVGAKGVFGCCLSPFPNCYFNFDIGDITILIFKG